MFKNNYISSMKTNSNPKSKELNPANRSTEFNYTLDSVGSSNSKNTLLIEKLERQKEKTNQLLAKVRPSTTK